MNDVIKVSNIKKSYGKQLALDDVSMRVPEGKIFGIVGENGAGKSTLLKIIAGHIMADGGDISLLGKSGAELPPIRRHFGFLIEQAHFISYLTARENMHYIARLAGVDDESRINDLLSLMKIHDTGRKKVSGFSTGMRQRLGIAAAMLTNPKVLVLDEPINGLDPVGIVELRNLLLKLKKEHNITIVVSSHILSELEIADEIAFIHKGHLLEQVEMEAIRQRARSYIEIKTDTPEMMLVHLEKKGYSDLKVVSPTDIRVYDEILDKKLFQKQLFAEDVDIISIKVVEGNLEDYYIDLIGGRKDA